MASLNMAEMPPLEPPDTYSLSAAVGWLELGNPAEAKSELAQVSPAQQSHPAVLELRWMICAEQQDWTSALDAARTLVERAPERPSGWLHQAYALRRVPGGSIQKASDVLRPAFDKFPKEFLIAYNLACYACQMNNLDEARIWLDRARNISSKGKVKQMALADSDLEPLWDEINKT
jgi:predicted Zn-dependent protease